MLKISLVIFNLFSVFSLTETSACSICWYLLESHSTSCATVCRTNPVHKNPAPSETVGNVRYSSNASSFYVFHLVICVCVALWKCRFFFTWLIKKHPVHPGVFILWHTIIDCINNTYNTSFWISLTLLYSEYVCMCTLHIPGFVCPTECTLCKSIVIGRFVRRLKPCRKQPTDQIMTLHFLMS